MIIGIDPGITGAMYFEANSTHRKVRTVIDIPIMAKSSGKGNQINPYELTKIIGGYFDN